MAERHSAVIAAKAVAQLAEALGFEAAQESAVDVLAGLMNRYIAQLCRSAHDYAELGGRTSFNVIDLLLVLEEMNVNLDELDKYVGAQEEVPFASSVSAYPVTSQTKGPTSFASLGEQPPAHVPAFLPAFPDKHTWVMTPVFAGRGADVRKAREEAALRRREGEQALVQLNRRLLPPGRGKGPAVNNPFLMTPEVVQPSRPAEEAEGPEGSGGEEEGEGGQGIERKRSRTDGDATPALSRQPSDAAAEALPPAEARLQLDRASRVLEPVLAQWQAREAEGPAEGVGVGWQEVAPVATDDPLLPQPAVLFQAHWAAAMRARTAAFSSGRADDDALHVGSGGAQGAGGRRRKSQYARLDPGADMARMMLEGGPDELNGDD